MNEVPAFDDPLLARLRAMEWSNAWTPTGDGSAGGVLAMPGHRWCCCAVTTVR